MSTDDYLPGLAATVEDFRRARRRAAIEELASRLTGRPTELFDYEEVSRLLHGRRLSERRREEISLADIAGSVGRYREFTRSFLPRDDHLLERWAGVKTAIAGFSGVPPIEVYRVGDTYFVRDGNHRVSVAREMGLETIEAFVTPVETRVPFERGDSLDDLILKAEFAAFLGQTNADKILPEADLRLTAPGNYECLTEHIEVHRHFMGLEKQREIPWDEAVTHWYEQVYLPTAELIRSGGLLRDFPHRTEADLYLWLSRYHAELEESLGWRLSRDTAMADFARQFGKSRRSRLKKHAAPRSLILSANEEATIEVRTSGFQSTTVNPAEFRDILVLVQGDKDGWAGAEQAFTLARLDGAAVGGMYVLDGDNIDTAKLEHELAARAARQGVTCQLAFEQGSTVERILYRARWTDLVVVGRRRNVNDDDAKRWSFLGRLLRSCPRPLLWAPEAHENLTTLLLAYDGENKAVESLYLAAYLARRHSASLQVFTGATKKQGSIIQERPKAYLSELGIDAEFHISRQDFATTVHRLADRKDIDLILAGGAAPRARKMFSGGKPGLRALLLGSERPVLICT